MLWYLKKGDIIQLFNASGEIYHSMIVYNDDVFCDGKHYGVEGECVHREEKEILYAQHTSNHLEGHLRTLLEVYANAKIVFIKIKKDI